MICFSVGQNGWVVIKKLFRSARLPLITGSAGAAWLDAAGAWQHALSTWMRETAPSSKLFMTVFALSSARK